MKRYIFLSVWCMLFFTAMNFGMDKTKQAEDIELRIALAKNGKVECMVYDGELSLLFKKSREQGICKFKPGKPIEPSNSAYVQDELAQKSEQQHFGLIIEEVKRPEDKELEEVINKLRDHFGRDPNIQEIKNEEERKNMVRHLDEWADNNPEIMQQWKKANEGLMKHCCDQFDQIKKLDEQIKKAKEAHPDWFK
jgi:hypothetical protein